MQEPFRCMQQPSAGTRQEDDAAGRGAAGGGRRTAREGRQEACGRRTLSPQSKEYENEYNCTNEPWLNMGKASVQRKVVNLSRDS
jgi:hypothetical protein